MDALLLARIQFGMTVGFHFIFPPITIGMAWIIFHFVNRWRAGGGAEYEAQARFWFRIFALTFAMGVATGITMEFQFGTNWANYSRFVGDIFGAPLAAEGIFAFFLESGFMGVMLFGWKRFSPNVMWFASLMVAVGATLSAFWIIVANSWMQTPAGFEIVDGRAVLTDFAAAVFNPSTMPRYIHTITACMTTGAFFVMGVSAWFLLRRREHTAFAQRALRVSLVFAFVSSVAQLPIGHWHGVQVADTQPEKLAAFEAHFDTQADAPMIIFGIPDVENEKVRFKVAVPSLLSLMVGNSRDTVVQGLSDFPKDERPPVIPVFTSFKLMIKLGLFFIGLTAAGMLLLRLGRLWESRWYMKLAMYSLPLPILASQLGWIAAEMGRQPWIVYRVPGMRTAEAISPSVSAPEILTTMILFAGVYALLFYCWIYLLGRTIRNGPGDTGHPAPTAPGVAS